MPIGKLSRFRSREQFLILAGLILGAVFLLKTAESSKDSAVPQQFLDARSKGAVIAEDIVALSKQSKKNLELISTEDARGDYYKAYDLVLRELAVNKEARIKALALSSELEIMAKEIPDIRKGQVAAIGLQATLNASQMVQRLIQYDDYTHQLISALNLRFNGDESGKTSATIKSTIKTMNQEAEEINNLNDKYKNLMTEFDKAAR